MRCIDVLAESNEAAASRLRSRMAWYESLALPAVEGCMTAPNKDAWCGCSPRATPGGSNRELLPIRHRGVERDLSRYGYGECKALLQVCYSEVNFADFRNSHDCIAATHRELLPEQQTGSYSRSVLLKLPSSTNCTFASRLFPESYSRCNRPGATPDRYCYSFRLPRITQLHRGC